MKAKINIKDIKKGHIDLDNVGLFSDLSEVVVPSTDKQAPSTQKILSRPKEEDKVARVREVSTNSQTTKSSTMEEINSKVIPRALTAEEIALEEGLRRKGHYNTDGQSEESAVDADKKKQVVEGIE